MPDASTMLIATRGSALALAQADLVLTQCRMAFPHQRFELRIIRTTGDKFETASLAQSPTLNKGLFTKELEVALLEHTADFAVHSLKDLPTELPAGLALAAVTRRADVRDVLIARRDKQSSLDQVTLDNLRPGAVVGTSSTRRRAQLLARRPDLNIVELRGNIITRLQKLGGQRNLDAIVLAAAGLQRMQFSIGINGALSGRAIPENLSATFLGLAVMLPCVGQGALGIEARANDEVVGKIVNTLNDVATQHCVTAERSFLAAMGGGCASPVAAHAGIMAGDLAMQAISFPDGVIHTAAGTCNPTDASTLGQRLADQLRSATARSHAAAPAT